MGIRVIKTAVAAIIAIYAARYFGLEPALSAGVLAILGVEVTRKKGLSNTFVRFVASVLGLVFASIIFFFLGFYYWTVAIFILISFPILSRFQLKEGIVTSCVIVFHLYTFGEVTLPLIWNEIALLLVGLGSATLINMFFMPKDETSIQAIRIHIEKLYYQMFNELAQTLRNPDHIWSGEELLVAEQEINNGISLSIRSKENKLWTDEGYWLLYFQMRREQLDCLSQMMEMVARIHQTLEHSEKIAILLVQLAEDTKSEVYVGRVKQMLEQLTEQFRGMALPTTRDEFEVRATLLMLMHEMHRYLDIARRLKRREKQQLLAE